jgi:hypothetical protein
LKIIADKKDLPHLRERLNAAGDAERAAAQEAVAAGAK